VLEAEERVLSSRHDASVAHETPDKRRHDDEVSSSAQSNAAEAAEMDEAQGEDEDETPAKRLRYDEAAVPTVTPAEQIQQQTHWDSTKAIIMFFPAEEDVKTRP
jgi:hypothetical protein